MAANKSGGRSAAANIIKVILLILAVIVVIAAVVVAVYFGTNGFGGSYPTFALKVNGQTITKSGALELPSGSTLNISGFEDYTLKVEAAEPEEDFKIKVGDAGMHYSELAGEDITSGFTFTKAEDGSIVMTYGPLEEVLSEGLGEDVKISDSDVTGAFKLIVACGDSVLELTHGIFDVGLGFDLELDPEHIVMGG